MINDDREARLAGGTTEPRIRALQSRSARYIFPDAPRARPGKDSPKKLGRGCGSRSDGRIGFGRQGGRTAHTRQCIDFGQRCIWNGNQAIRQSGNQAVGLYSADNARGFSPAQAQNRRIEGLYFYQQTSGTQPYLFSGSRLRVGISAQSYAFPSPSGVADLILRKPGDNVAASVVLTRGPLSNASAEIDTQYPLIPHSLQMGVNVAAAHDFDYNFARTSDQSAVAMVSSYQLNPTVEFIPFLGYVHNRERQETPIVFADRSHPVVLFSEQHLPTQSWTRWDWSQLTGGIIGTAAISTGWSLRAGLFRSA